MQSSNVCEKRYESPRKLMRIIYKVIKSSNLQFQKKRTVQQVFQTTDKNILIKPRGKIISSPTFSLIVYPDEYRLQMFHSEIHNNTVTSLNVLNARCSNNMASCLPSVNQIHNTHGLMPSFDISGAQCLNNKSNPLSLMLYHVTCISKGLAITWREERDMCERNRIFNNTKKE